MAQKLTQKQKRFCDFYIKYCDAARAAREAGYSEKTAKNIGSENLAKPYLREYIDKRLAKLDADRIASAEETLRFLTEVMRGEAKEEVLLGFTDGEAEIYRKQVAAKERLKAAELIGKRYGLFVDNINLAGDVGVQILNDIPKDADKAD